MLVGNGAMRHVTCLKCAFVFSALMNQILNALLVAIQILDGIILIAAYNVRPENILIRLEPPFVGVALQALTQRILGPLLARVALRDITL